MGTPESRQVHLLIEECLAAFHKRKVYCLLCNGHKWHVPGGLVYYHLVTDLGEPQSSSAACNVILALVVCSACGYTAHVDLATVLGQQRIYEAIQIDNEGKTQKSGWFLKKVKVAHSTFKGGT